MTAARPRAWIDERVFFAVWDEGLRTDVLDLQTGALRWRAPGESIRAVTDGLAFLETDEGGVRAREAATGDPVWHEPLAAGRPSAPDWQPSLRYHAGTLLVVVGATLLGLAPDTGRIRWQFEAEDTLRRYWRPIDGSVLLSTRNRVHSVGLPT